MKIYPPNAEFNSIDQKKVDENLWSQIFQSNNLLIPIEINTKDKIVGLFVFDHHNLPIGGQKFLLDIAGSPFTPELAGVKVFFSPIVPALQKNYEKALIMLADSIDRCDGSTHSHVTSLWAERIAKHMGLAKEEVQRIKLAAKLHDIGKAVVPREILIKPGPLSKEEWEIIRQHPGYGATLMEPAQSLDEIRPLVHSHHEHYSGDGYPDGLRGDQIPLGARIISVADAYSTMTIRRVYRTPVSVEVAKNELVRCLGTQFDPLVVDHMLEILPQPGDY
jgi:HD-GYP domain-containing protein (c-di-GMP phosphodiesterase class II)